MKLVDTSSWIEQLRPRGNAEVRQRVDALLRGGQASWCAPVRLELWMGVRGDHEKTVPRRYEQVLPDLEITGQIWEEACDLARRARAAALTCPSPDVLIAACARHYDMEIDAVDGHFAKLMAL
ncbi:MAG: PIN domain-containing protein [Chthoniobacter sp.]|uniref:PIN domain-containing protein n=1 Tax=Chthoniobacter sp. TaxID=2510640 RepID=UPI0032A4B3C7